MSCACCSDDSKSRETYEPFIDPAVLAQRCPLDNGEKSFKNAMAGPSSQNWTECRLQSLPVEIYQACLQHLDIATLTNMRSVSQYTRYTIDSLHKYTELYTHAPQALRACLSTGIAPHIPLLRLHQSLTSMECYYCKTSNPPKSQFGSYLSLYEGRRSCLFCLRNNPELKPVELITLLSLCCQRNCSIRSIDNFRLLGTLPGTYGPSFAPVTLRSTLVRGSSVTTISGSTLTEKEQCTLFGNPRTATIYHHPLVKPEDESEIGPSTGYIAPDATKKAAQTYMSAVLFPYLTTSKRVADYGILCGDCNLHMQFEEARWKAEQNTRRRNRQDPSASLRTRAFINDIRQRACIQYTVSSEAKADESKMVSTRKVTEKADPNAPAPPGMTIQAHRMIHFREKLPLAEREYRAKLKSPAPAPATTV